MVKSLIGIDLNKAKDYFPTGEVEHTVWFMDVEYNSVNYKVIKVYPTRVELFIRHPLEQSGPNIVYTIDIVEESRFPL